MEITRDTTSLQGKTPVWVPEQMASLWSNYLLGGSLEGCGWAPACARGGGRDGCRQHRQGAGLPADGHVRLLRSRRPQREPEEVGVSLSASNLLNKTYYSCYDQNNCWFGAQRNLEARLKYAF